MAARKNRVAIVTDGDGWYVRRIRVIEHDLDRDEKVYRCDIPVGTRFDTVDEAVSLAKQYLGLNQ
jgi:hypothetical protein